MKMYALTFHEPAAVANQVKIWCVKHQICKVLHCHRSLLEKLKMHLRQSNPSSHGGSCINAI